MIIDNENDPWPPLHCSFYFFLNAIFVKHTLVCKKKFDNKNIPYVFDDERYEKLPSAILKLYRPLVWAVLKQCDGSKGIYKEMNIDR